MTDYDNSLSSKKRRRIDRFDDVYDDRGLAFREIFTRDREGPLQPRPSGKGAGPMTSAPPVLSSVWSAADAALNGMTLSNGGLTATLLSGSGSKSIRNTVSKSSGKVYIEFLCSSTNGGNYGLWGVGSSGFDPTSYFGSSPFSAGIYSGNQTFVSAGFTSNYAVPFTAPNAGDVYALAVNFTTGTIWIALNNVWQNSSNPVSGSLPIVSFVLATVGALFAGLSMNSGIAITAWTLQATAATQKYAPPSGFSAWG